nr:hypothetical protein [Bacteroidota bacterium]
MKIVIEIPQNKADWILASLNDIPEVKYFLMTNNQLRTKFLRHWQVAGNQNYQLKILTNAYQNKRMSGYEIFIGYQYYYLSS